MSASKKTHSRSAARRLADPDYPVLELIARLRGSGNSYLQLCDDADWADEIPGYLVNIAGMVLHEIDGLTPNTQAALEQISKIEVPEDIEVPESAAT